MDALILMHVIGILMQAGLMIVVLISLKGLVIVMETYMIV